MGELSARFGRDGYLVIDRLVDRAWCAAAISLCDRLFSGDQGRRPGVRRVLQKEPRLGVLLADPSLAGLVGEAAGAGACLVRSILFDKSPSSNWAVAWHQDAVIAVRERVDVPGFGPWSVKGGETHCRPPREVMDSVAVVRVHLDACGPDNGPLRLVPGSHRHGVIPEVEVDRVATQGPVVECCTGVGGAVVMRPHTVHASARSTGASRRRVLHLEYSAMELPGGLAWAESGGHEHTVVTDE